MKPQVVLRVNKAEGGRVLANMYTKVNSKAIKRVTYNGREHWVIPSYTLPANVIMNGGLYTAEEIDAHYKGLEGTPAPLGHPAMDGKFISARVAEGLNLGWVGAWNRNVKKSGNRIYLEKWVDIEVAQQTEKGRELLARLEALEKGDDVPPIHSSVAMFLIEEPAAEGEEHDWVARIQEMDHDAILLDEVGAATPEQGVGLMVNADKARSLVANAGVLSETSVRSQERRLEQAARDRFVTEGDDGWVFIADFDDKQAIVVVSGDASVYGYTYAEGVITFEDNGTPVERQESWVRRLPGVNALLDFLNPNRARPENLPKESDMPLTKEEMAEITQGVGAVVANALADALKPVVDGLGTIQANQSKLEEGLTANSRREEDEMRQVVKEKHGEIIANNLKGEDLIKVYKECGTAAPLLNGNHSTQKPTGLGVPAVDDYFREGAK
jgi:hypothetical protein